MAEESFFEMYSSSSSTPADCRFGIELTCEVSVYNVTGRPQAWRMRITVTDYYNIDPNIFMYLRTGPNAAGVLQDTFESVASPVDITEYPAGAPDTNQDPAFYRLAEIDILSRNRTLLDETWRLIKADRDELVRTMTNICELEEDAVSRYGYFPEEPPTPPVPPVPPSSSSSDVPVCPDDQYDTLVVTESNDPDFPVGTEITEEGSQTGPPTCLRTWRVTGAVTGKILELQTTLAYHTFTAYIDTVEVDAGGIGDGYAAYVYFNGFVVRIAGVESSS